MGKRERERSLARQTGVQIEGRRAPKQVIA